jgi:putative FmdB family regulatory protein
MPVYEYRCKSCDEKYEVFHRGKEEQEKVICPSCNSKESKKLLSGFNASVNSSSDSPCASGSCGIPAAGVCGSGMCGLN